MLSTIKFRSSILLDEPEERPVCTIKAPMQSKRRSIQSGIFRGIPSAGLTDKSKSGIQFTIGQENQQMFIFGKLEPIELLYFF